MKATPRPCVLCSKHTCHPNGVCTACWMRHKLDAEFDRKREADRERLIDVRED